MKYFSKIIQKYNVLIKYLLVAILSFILDILLFNIFNHLWLNIILATILARVISATFNFLLNRNKVFKSSSKASIALVKYFSLVIMQMLVSAFTVDFLAKFISINPTFIKIPVEFILFICNYLIQKFLIFQK